MKFSEPANSPLHLSALLGPASPALRSPQVNAMVLGPFALSTSWAYGLSATFCPSEDRFS